VFLLTRDSLESDKALFALACASVYEKKLVVLHVKDSCPFPKYEEQPQEFREFVLMENVISYTSNRSRAALKDLDDILQLVFVFPFTSPLSFF